MPDDPPTHKRAVCQHGARPDRDQRLARRAVLEFGSPGCGHCRLAQPLIERVLAELEGVVHLKMADGPGQPLGRSFHVKLWPTLVFLRDGVELARLVRPRGPAR